jgi:threonine aldolase
VTLDFRSDNTHGASPEILEALARASSGTIKSYGGDAITERLRERCAEVFDHEVAIFPVVTGTAGNALTIGAMTKPWGAVFCHDEAHVYREELGAPELFSGGAKLIPISGANGKVEPDALARAIDNMGLHFGGTSCVSLTQATEAGTVYTPDELRALCDVAHAHECRVHLDGARFANAVAHLGVAPAELAWRAGVDALVLGATKNGVLAAEVILAFDPTLAEELAPRWHRSGHRLSKMRFLSAQLEAYLTGDLWLRNARHANAMAQRLAAGIGNVIHPVEANVVFTRFPKEVPGFTWLDWTIFGPDAVRLVTAFDTREEDVDALIDAARARFAR